MNSTLKIVIRIVTVIFFILGICLIFAGVNTVDFNMAMEWTGNLFHGFATHDSSDGFGWYLLVYPFIALVGFAMPAAGLGLDIVCVIGFLLTFIKKKCPYCHRPIKVKGRFCNYCGHPLS